MRPRRRVSDQERWLRDKAERDSQKELMEAAGYLGWLCFHDHDSRRDNEKAGVNRGFPDTILVHPIQRRFVAIELKTETGDLSDDQVIWLAALMAIPSIEVYTARPRDWDRILEILQKRPTEVGETRQDYSESIPI